MEEGGQARAALGQQLCQDVLLNRAATRVLQEIEGFTKIMKVHKKNSRRVYKIKRLEGFTI